MSGEAVNIKGTRNGLVILFNPESDPEDIKSNLKLKMEKSNGFFKGARFSFSNAHGEGSLHFIKELEGICLQYGLIPSGEASKPTPPVKQDSPSHHTRKQSQVVPLRQPSPGEEKATILARTIRSGQRIFSAGTLVILGDVNPGAEVISESSIYIMGSCKGSVHAGSQGNIHCEVFAFKFQPIALCIGTICDAPSPPSDPGPYMAKVGRGKITFSRYSNNFILDY